VVLPLLQLLCPTCADGQLADQEAMQPL
jgi:hypothetical protein